MKTLTYNDIAIRASQLSLIPVASLSGATLAAVALLGVDYNRTLDSFRERVRAALDKIKAEKYPLIDSEARKPEAERDPAFQSWTDELRKAEDEIISREAAQPAPQTPSRLDRQLLTDICRQLDTTATIPDPRSADKDSPEQIPLLSVILSLANLVED